VAQPYSRKVDVPPAGPLDVEAGQFWVGNAWQIVSEEKNLSGYERNRTYMNLGAGRFVDVSYLTGTDSDGDGRSAVGADLNNDGMQDLIVRQAGGGPLLLFLNRFPKQHYLRVSLRGTKSNGQGIGARLIAEVSGRQIVRELFPANSYMSQQPNEVHFNLAHHTRVEKLTIRWPSGLVQELEGIPADQHIRVQEGEPPQLLAARSGSAANSADGLSSRRTR
jgi:hypothetical protein